MGQSKAQPAPAAAPAPSDETPPTLAERLQPFMVDADPPADLQHLGGNTYRVMPSALARMFADLAARMAALGDAALPDGIGLSVNVAMQPARLSFEREATEAEECLAVSAVVDAIEAGVEPKRDVLDFARAVHFRGSPTTAAGLAVTVLCGVEPRPGELPAADVEPERLASVTRPDGTSGAVAADDVRALAAYVERRDEAAS